MNYKSSFSKSWYKVMLALAWGIMLAYFSTDAAIAAVSPSNLFSDNALLQAGREVPVWGWDNPGQDVTVTIGQTTVKGKADQNGRWEVRLPAMKADDKPQELKIVGSSAVSAKNVLVGEVWLCGGQSNMAWTMNADSGKAAAKDKDAVMKFRATWNYPALRMFTVVERAAAPGHVKDVQGVWTVGTPNTCTIWSALGFYLATNLQKDLGGEPVGIITSAVGGTPISIFMSTADYEKVRPDQAAATEKAIADTAKQADDWYEKKTEAKDVDPKAPDSRRPFRVWPGSFYTGMFEPLMPYALKGIVWYQGESDGGRPADIRKDYGRSLDLFIDRLRTGFKQGDIPFVDVQLHNCTAQGSYCGPETKLVQEDPVEIQSNFPPIREMQRRVIATKPNAGLAVVIDHPDPNGVHPSGKAMIGQRVALQALKLAYGKKDLVASGPMFAGCVFSGNKATVKFTDIGSGLVTKDNGPIKGFALSGSDGKWFWADGTIQGDKVLLTAKDVSNPTALRYDWAENPIGNLYNKEGLPAAPFATDDNFVGGSAKK